MYAGDSNVFLEFLTQGKTAALPAAGSEAASECSPP